MTFGIHLLRGIVKPKRQRTNYSGLAVGKLNQWLNGMLTPEGLQVAASRLDLFLPNHG